MRIILMSLMAVLALFAVVGTAAYAGPADCTESQFFDTGSNTCKDNCPSGKIGITTTVGSQCVTACGENQHTVIVMRQSDNAVFAQCSSNDCGPHHNLQTSDDENNMCTGHCFTQTGDESIQCTHACPSVMPLLEGGTCTASCSAGLPFVNVITKDVSNSDTDPNDVTPTTYRTCVDSCPADKSFIINGNECAASCPNDLTLLDGQTCVASCPDDKNLKVGNSCVASCPTDKPYIDGDQCVASCPTERSAIVDNTCTMPMPDEDEDHTENLCYFRPGYGYKTPEQQGLTLERDSGTIYVGAGMYGTADADLLTSAIMGETEMRIFLNDPTNTYDKYVVNICETHTGNWGSVGRMGSISEPLVFDQHGSFWQRGSLMYGTALLYDPANTYWVYAVGNLNDNAWLSPYQIVSLSSPTVDPTPETPTTCEADENGNFVDGNGNACTPETPATCEADENGNFVDGNGNACTPENEDNSECTTDENGVETCQTPVDPPESDVTFTLPDIENSVTSQVNPGKDRLISGLFERDMVIEKVTASFDVVGGECSLASATLRPLHSFATVDTLTCESGTYSLTSDAYDGLRSEGSWQFDLKSDSAETITVSGVTLTISGAEVPDTQPLKQFVSGTGEQPGSPSQTPKISKSQSNEGGNGASGASENDPANNPECTPGKTQNLEERIDRLQTRIDKAQEKLDNTDPSKQKRIDKLQAQIDKMTDRKVVLENRLAVCFPA